MDDQDDFIMGNIISPSNTNNPLQFQSSQDKRKSKKEKYFAKKLLSNKRKREKKAPKENANTQSTFQKPFISKGYRPLLNRPKPETTTATTKTTEAATVIPQELQNDKTESNQQNNEIPLNENNQPNNKEIKEITNTPTTQPTQIKTVFSVKTFNDLQINEYLKKNIAKNNYDTMTKIQKKAIPILLEHRNVVVKSETGSGKTLAYVIPLYEQLININQHQKIDRKQGVYAIIVAPTHELCLQIEETFNKLKSSCIHVVYGCLIGGQNLNIEKKKLRKGLNVIIATPGRLLFHLKNTVNINFSTLKTIIFDEADLLLSMGFEKDIKQCFREILKKDPENKITDETELNYDMFKKYKIFLISATINNQIRSMTSYLMKGFKAIGFEQSNKKNTENENAENDNEDNNNINNSENITIASGIKQYYSNISDEFRLISLLGFLYTIPNAKIIIFVSTCVCVDFLQKLLSEAEVDLYYDIDETSKRKLPKDKVNTNQKAFQSKSKKIKFITQTVYKLHGKMKHDERKEIFNNFNKNPNSILISTDVGARGLDFPNITWVIHYDINPDIKEYVNRIGRTARLDKAGNSLLFLMQNEEQLLTSCFKSIQPQLTQMPNNSILNDFVDKININLLNKPIMKTSLPFEDEVDSNERFRKEHIYAISPIKQIIKDFIFADKTNLALARSAFKSEMRSYVTFMKYDKKVFNIKALNLTRMSRSFGLYKETMKIKIGTSEVMVDYEYEKTNVRAEKKYLSKSRQNKLLISEFE